jgi:uncharacterized protein with PhoU and TrkA domain
MADKRDICEKLEDQSIDGAIFLRRNAAKEIRALRHYVAQLEHDLVEEEHQHAKTIIKLENAREHIFDQALDIATLGQEVGRLREEQPQIDYVIDSHGVTHRSFTLVYKARAALAEKEEK